jgi:hypothetical protein
LIYLVSQPSNSAVLPSSWLIDVLLAASLPSQSSLHSRSGSDSLGEWYCESLSSSKDILS